MLICFSQLHFYYSRMLTAVTFLSLTAERAAGVDADRPHVGLIRVTDAVVEGDEDAEGRTQQTQDQQAQNQRVQDRRANAFFCQHRNHYTHTHTHTQSHTVQENYGYII